MGFMLLVSWPVLSQTAPPPVKNGRGREETNQVKKCSVSTGRERALLAAHLLGVETRLFLVWSSEAKNTTAERTLLDGWLAPRIIMNLC